MKTRNTLILLFDFLDSDNPKNALIKILEV